MMMDTNGYPQVSANRDLSYEGSPFGRGTILVIATLTCDGTGVNWMKKWKTVLQYDAEEAGFTVGHLLTGLTSGAGGIITKIIPGGRCATLRHVGSDDTLFQAVNFMYQTWLPQSGAQLRDFPLYLQRVAFAPEVAPDAAVTDIFLPIT